MVENLRDVLTARFKSVEPCDKWLDREDHAIAENRHAYFGISEYGGVASVWVVRKQDDDGYHGYRENLSQHWVNSIRKAFRAVVAETVGEKNTLTFCGRFSNGESMYQRGVIA